MSQLNLKHLLIVLLFSMGFSCYSQLDSTSTITQSEYREDTLFYQEITMQNFLEGKLIYERKQKGIGWDEFDYEVLNNFYDHNGELRESVLIERDGYDCPAKASGGLFSNNKIPESHLLYTVTGVEGTRNSLMLPDSLPDYVPLCGRYYKKHTHYQRYLHVSNTIHYYDDDEPNYYTDSIFFNRYGEKIREVTYNESKLVKEEVYIFKYDAQQRVVEKVWENLTPGKELEQVLRYQYQGERQLQVYNSNHFIHQNQEKSYSTTEYDEKGRSVKHQRFMGDSLVKTYLTDYVKHGAQKSQIFAGDLLESTSFYTSSDFERKRVVVNADGDTTDFFHSIRVKKKNRVETWSYQPNRSYSHRYAVRDSIPTKNGYKIKLKTYRITETQFEKLQAARLSKSNHIIHNETNTYDEQGRLIREEEFDHHYGEKDLRWEYGE